MSALHEHSLSPAEIYEEAFVPALFQQWGDVMTEAASVGFGHRVLDVACGTGVAACAAAERAGAQGSVVGLDPNSDMLAVAAFKHPLVEWREGRGEALPFPDASFDRVVSQFGLMFFDDPAAGLREMMRVLRTGGKLAVAVCDALDHSPGYAVLVELLHRLFGPPVADAFRAPFILGDQDRLQMLCLDAGLSEAGIERRDGNVHFASISDLITTERACAWTLGGILDDEEFDRLDREAQVSLLPFQHENGWIDFTMPALIVSAQKAP
ncbi:methyltransferase domain-containing protein [Modicisalibacter xianhensis]|uniref:Methyltransferase domain-containing protein n=1 Tax=Modicisalibacter xianhensis TaxID=442341 RepID=A0A1I3BFV2_9GAMM|nr:methyltransferase domain-containing protein [Halomonas xianhensis]SFH61163.1 Methyltransferase domain-containing protein [Halomonas xianhensis]